MFESCDCWIKFSQQSVVLCGVLFKSNGNQNLLSCKSLQSKAITKLTDSHLHQYISEVDHRNN